MMERIKSSGTIVQPVLLNLARYRAQLKLSK
ncbi:hypothetical protein DFQ00_104181 [Paenibacillus barcinonensis]|uniref:Uncharacterized protein n=1 Tax=Paenibacillus barcinonensis TaxID=198119 RepID=A0A2V4WQC4_PAEBA|nr:hypothetical protein DFQ00_104181 [Paenibacillus barcinonensis]